MQKIREKARGYGIKICGIQNTASVKHCLKMDVDWIGFNFTAHSPRAIRSMAEGKSLLRHCPTKKSVAIFQNQSVQEITTLMQQLSLNNLQLSEPWLWDTFNQLSEKYSIIVSIPVARMRLIKKNTRKEQMIEALIQKSLFVLIEGEKPGSGQTWDFSQMQQFADVFTANQLSKIKFWLAGGVHAHNVANIVDTVASVFPSKLHGFDCASGVEEIDARGHVQKSNEKITKFIRTVRDLE